MKADKGNCLVIMDRSDYDSKMENLLQDENTYTVVRKPLFKKVERELNALLLSLKSQRKLPEKTYRYLHSSDAIPPAIRGSIKHHKLNFPLRPIVTSIDSALYNTSKFLSQILSATRISPSSGNSNHILSKNLYIPLKTANRALRFFF